MTKIPQRFNITSLCSIALVFCLVFLSSCGSLGIQNVNDLLRAPALGQGQGEIQKALAAAIGEEPQYIFPKEGAQRSPLIMADFDGDGENEGVLLYTFAASAALSRNRGSNVYVALMKQVNGEWKLQHEFRGLATDVADFEVADLLGNGTKQLIIGFATANLNSKTFALYEYTAEEFSLVYQSAYSRYALNDFTGRGGVDLLVASAYDQVSGPQLIYIPVERGQFVAPQFVKLDASFSSCAGMYPSLGMPEEEEGQDTAGEEQTRLVVVDGVLETGILASQFVYYKGGKFYVLDDSGALRGKTARTSPLLRARDIDHDGYVEIPQQVEGRTDSGTTTNRGLIYVEWINFILREEATVERWGVMDSDRNVFISLPNDWRGNIKIIDGAADGEWQMINTNTLETLMIMRELPVGSVLPQRATPVPGTVDSYLVFQQAVPLAEQIQVAMCALAG